MLRITHRLTPADDRRIAAGSMALDPDQEAALATLDRGEAVVWAEGMDGAVQVRLPAPRLRARASDDPRQRAARSLGGAAAAIHHALDRRRQQAVLASDDVRAVADGVLAIAAVAAPAPNEVDEVRIAMRRTFGRLRRPASPTDVAAASTLALQDAWSRRSGALGLSERAWWRGVTALARDPSAFLASLAGTRHRSAGPHDMCRSCPDACRWLYEGSETGRIGTLAADVDDALAGPASALGTALVEAVDGALAERIPGLRAVSPALYRCVVGHALTYAGRSARLTRAVLARLPT